MKKLDYDLVDVFTSVPFGGNQLAVFHDAQHIPELLMPVIAKELSLSETTFVLPPSDASYDCRVRIFTPSAELPFAGHPTLGTAFARHLRGGDPRGTREVLELGIGPVPVTCRPDSGGVALVEMEQPLATFGATSDDRNRVAAMLSLEPQDLALERAPAQVVSSGLPLLFVPVTSQVALRRIVVRADLASEVLGSDARGVFAWTDETVRPGSTVHGRMFAPALGIFEDPATGSAAGPLASYLLKHAVVPPAPIVRVVTEQGFAMGRPSLIYATAEMDGDNVSALRVSGHAVLVGHGTFEVPEAMFG